MSLKKTSLFITVLFLTAISATFFYSNCQLEVVGTGNPKPPSEPPRTPNDMVQKICGLLATCGLEQNQCIADMLNSAEVALAFGLNPITSGNLDKVNYLVVTNSVAFDSQSANECLSMISVANCQSKQGQSFSKQGVLNLPILASSIAGELSCRDAINDHLEFKDQDLTIDHNLNSLARAPVLSFGGHKYVGNIFENRFSLLEYTNGQLNVIGSATLRAPATHWVWSSSVNKVEACLMLSEIGAIDCISADSQFALKVSRSYDITSAMGGSTTKDFALALSDNGNEFFLILTSSKNYLLTIGPDKIVHTHAFPSGFQSPKSIVNFNSLLNSHFVFFPRVGFLPVGIDLGNDQDMNAAGLFSTPTLDDGGIFQTEDKTWHYVGIDKEKRQLSTGIWDPNTLKVSETSSRDLSLNPDRISLYQLNAGINGVLLSFVSQTQIACSFLINGSTLSQVVFSDLGIPVTSFQTGDLNNDRKDDIFINTIDTTVLKVLIKQ